MAPTPVSASVPIEQHVVKSTEPLILTDPQFSSYLLSVLKKNAQLGPDDPMAINGDSGKVLTYQQFLEQTVRTVNALRALGLVPGDAVSFIARNTQYTFSTAIAIYIAGMLEHPLFPYLEPELVSDQIRIVKPRIIFTEAFALDKVRAAIKPMTPKPRVVVFDSETVDANMLTMDEFLRLGGKVDLDTFEEAYVENPGEDDALIIFTTGSTGVPKPVVHSSKGVHSILHMSSNMFSSPTLMGPFVSWIAGHCTMLSLLNDRVSHIYSPELNLDKTEQFIKEYKIRTIIGSPFSALQMALRGPYPDHLERILVGGSPMRKDTEAIIRKAMGPNASLMPVYGSTESGFVIGHRYKGDANIHYANGKMNPGAEIQIRDLRTGFPLGPNQKGEVFIRSHSTFKGYLNNPKLTRETVDEHGWIKMGDFGYFDEDHFVYILDRLKDIVFYKEHIILPSELSDVIRLHPDVMDAAVGALPHPEDRHRPIAFISMKPGKKMTEDEVNQHILKYLDDSHLLRGGVVFLEQVPRTLSGKVVSTELSRRIQQMVDAAAS